MIPILCEFRIEFPFINFPVFSFIVKGASGGLGSGGVGSSRGAVAVAVLELHKNEELYILVGQQGENGCIKSLGYKEDGCGSNEAQSDLKKYSFTSKQHMLKNMSFEFGAGGGGGASYVFLVSSVSTSISLWKERKFN